MRIKTRVITPLPVNAPVGSKRKETDKGTITRFLGDDIAYVTMDNGVVAPWMIDTLRENEMDPNATLRLLRLTIKQRAVDTDPHVRAAHSAEIVEYVTALDEWLSKGGALPSDWQTY